MGYDANRSIGAGSGGGTWYSGLASLFGLASKPSPAPAAPADDLSGASVQDLLDRLSVTSRPATPATTANGVAGTLSLIATPGGAARVTPQAWEALGRAYASTTGVGRSQIAQQLAAGGFHAEASADRRYVTFTNGTLYATSEPATDRLRLTNGNQVACYSGIDLIKTMRVDGNTVTVDDPREEEVWDTQTGQGTMAGVPVAPRMAPVDPSEPPRQPWTAPEPDDLQEPTWSPSTPLGTYGQAYDAAVAAMGGEVVAPSQTADGEAEQFNCHSYSLTGGQGDLFDPYSRPGFPHWLNNPMYQLTTGPYAQLAPTQRVHPGDIVVYRNNGVVTHTGVVRAVDDDGNPSQIESKFGALGLYVHEPFDIPPEYGQPAEIFRPDGG